MFKIISSLVLSFLLCFTTQAQDKITSYSAFEEIAVSYHFTALLLFDEAVQEVIIPSKAYVAKVNKNMILLRATKPGPADTSLVVTFKRGAQVFYGRLHFTHKPQEVYDFTTKQETLAAEEALLPPLNNDTIAKIKHIKDLPQTYFHIGKYSKYYDVILTNLFHDDHYTYIKIYLENKTALTFELFETTFNHYNSKSSRKLVYPVYGLEERLIPAYSSKMLLYVLPKYTTARNGKLMITFVEQSGSRFVTLSLPARLLLEAQYYGKSA